jgi:hypothetical protein
MMPVDRENYPKAGKFPVKVGDAVVADQEPDEINYKPQGDPEHKVGSLGDVGAKEPDWPKGGPPKNAGGEAPKKKDLNLSAFDTQAPGQFQMGELRVQPKSPGTGKD